MLNDLVSGMRRDGSFRRQSTDKIRLATAVHKKQPVFLSQGANHRQATEDLLKNWFRTTNGGQEYNIFVIFERLQIPESEDDASYDMVTYKERGETQSAVKKDHTEPAVGEKSVGPVVKKEPAEPVVKQERIKKERTRKQPTIKIEKEKSPVRSMQDISNSQSASRKRSRSDLSSPLPEPPQFVYRTRQRHDLDEEDHERIAQYD